MDAEQRAHDILTSVPGGQGYWGRLEDAIAAALRQARAEAIEPLQKLLDSMSAELKEGPAEDWPEMAAAIASVEKYRADSP